MSYSTTRGYWRQTGVRDGLPAVLPAMLKCSGDPTLTVATAMTVGSGATAKLPKGAIPVSVSSLGGATGDSTVDIGDGSDADGFANELAADNVSMRTVTGALIGTELTVETTLYMVAGASAATGGTTSALVEYVMADDAKVAHA